MTLTEHRQCGTDAPLTALLSSAEWRPFIDLVGRWYRQPISGATGVQPAVLSSLEARHGRSLPATLREWYRLFGNHESQQDQTSTDYEMPLRRVWDNERYVGVYGENQDCWFAGVLNEHCSLPDPPVYFDSHSFDPARDLGLAPDSLIDGHYIRVCDRLSDFLVGVAVRQITIRCEPSPFLHRDVTGGHLDGFLDSLGGRPPLRKVFDFPAGFSPLLGEDLLVAEDSWFAARTPGALADIGERVPAIADRLWRVT